MMFTCLYFFYNILGHIYNTRRCSMAMDVVSVFNELHAQLVRVCRRMVADRTKPRRFGILGKG